MKPAQLGHEAERAAPGVAKKVEEVQDFVQQLHCEIRTTSYLLHPPLLDESGLPSALNWYASSVSSAQAFANSGSFVRMVAIRLESRRMCSSLVISL